MGLVDLTILAVVLSVDAFGIGVSCGFGQLRIAPWPRAVISLVSFALTGGAVVIGGWLSGFVSEEAGDWIGAGLLMLVGFYMMLSAAGEMTRKRKCGKNKRSKARGTVLGNSARVLRDPNQCDSDGSKSIDVREAAAIGLAVSADSLAAGLGTGLSGGMSDGMVFWLPAFCAAFQLMMFWTGEKIARRLKKLTGLDGGIVEMVVGFLLVVMALTSL